METKDDRAGTDDEGLDQRKIIPEWSVAADDQIVLVAFLFLTLLLGTLGWNAWRDGDDPTTAALSADVEASGDIDLTPVENEYGIAGRMDGSTAVLTGVVATEAARTAAGDSALAVDGVTRVDNRLRLAAADDVEEEAAPSTTEAPATTEAPTTTAAPAVDPAEATVTATPNSIVLAGTVPSEDTAQQIRDTAAASYSDDQITDELEVLEGADPFTLTVTGDVASQSALDSLSAGFGGIAGADVTNQLEADSGSVAAAALNELFALQPILFESGTDVILSESLPTLDAAVEILKANPDAVIEIGGHTDSRGDDAANLALSDRRAAAVLAALQERGVTNELTAVGYGETQLLENPDDTPEQQQANRRIEFTAL